MSDKGSLIKKQEGSSDRCVRFSREGDCCHCSLHGSWSLKSGEVRIALAEWKRFLSDNPTASTFRFSTAGLGKWDSALIVFLNQCRHDLAERKKEFDTTELPRGIARLLSLSIGKKAGKRRREFILNRSIDYLEVEIVRFRDRVKVVPDGPIVEAFGTVEADYLFGRSNVISGLNGEVIAQIVEILPPL